MRWRDTKESQNVEDYRGRSTGTGSTSRAGAIWTVFARDIATGAVTSPAIKADGLALGKGVGRVEHG